jgi:hypothetical protein
MSIEQPANEEESVMAAIIYAEAKVARGETPTTEMLAVGWTLRNRYLHVRTTYGAPDRKWFGSGATLESIATHGSEFVSASGSRYKTFRTNLSSITHPGEVTYGNLCVAAAREVLAAPEPATPGVTGTYPFVWFQKASRRPSNRASQQAVAHGEHNFWSFAPGRERG